MTLRGVGIDVADISRVGALLERHGSRFQTRWFHADELTQHGDLQVVAARCFAVKEAVWKALRQESSGPLPWRDIHAVPAGPGEVVQVLLRGRLADNARADRVGAITATATVRGNLVVAIAMIESAETE